jgi:uncharacterized protein DUF4440
MDPRDELLRLKQAALDASARLDGDFYDAYLADGARALTPAGVATKAQVVAAARVGGFRCVRVDDTEVDLLCADVGVVTYRATFALPAGETVDMLVSTVYRRDGGGWKGVLYQQTPVSAKVRRSMTDTG